MRAKSVPKKKLKEYQEWLKAYKILINFCQIVIDENPNSDIAEEHKKYIEYFQKRAIYISNILKNNI